MVYVKDNLRLDFICEIVSIWSIINKKEQKNNTLMSDLEKRIEI